MIFDFLWGVISDIGIFLGQIYLIFDFFRGVISDI